MPLRIVCVIPARLASTRFPRKVLARIGEKTMLHHVYDAAKKCPQFSEVFIATDSEEVMQHAHSFGAKCAMTSSNCVNGTARLIEFRNNSSVKADIWVCWQGDEPLVTPQMIEDLLRGSSEGGAIWTLKKEINRETALDPNIVKVVSNRFGDALYFSRSLIPYDRDGTNPTFFKHIGLYAYSDKILDQIQHFPLGELVIAENLEQLSFLENGLSIRVNVTSEETIGVDTPQDLLKATLILL